MEQSSRAVDPPFSPVLLTGLALAWVPPQLFQPIFDTLRIALLRRHPDLLERLSAYPDAIIGIDPVDLPFVLILEPRPAGPLLKVRRDFAQLSTTAVVRGSLAMLLALAEGRLDGDAAFFGRQLAFEGDTEVVLALRNAVDGAGIELLADLSAMAGPLARPLRGAAGLAGRLFNRLLRDMQTVRLALLGPTLRGADAQAARIAELEDELAALRGGVRQRERAT
jgi:predicted lipid carrier protein YhbT